MLRLVTRPARQLRSTHLLHLPLQLRGVSLLFLQLLPLPQLQHHRLKLILSVITNMHSKQARLLFYNRLLHLLPLLLPRLRLLPHTLQLLVGTPCGVLFLLHNFLHRHTLIFWFHSFTPHSGKRLPARTLGWTQWLRPMELNLGSGFEELTLTPRTSVDEDLIHGRSSREGDM